MRPTRAVACLLVPALLAACSGDATSAPPGDGATSATGKPPIATVTITATDCVLDAGHTPVPMGDASIVAVNDTDVDAEFHMWAMDADRWDDFVTRMQEEVRRSEAGEPFIGPPDWAAGPFPQVELAPGETGSLDGFLGDGTWGIACLKTYEELGEIRVSGFAGPIEVTKE